MPPRILLADADAFFVAVARMVDPEGAGKAPLLIVGGSADGRGVVCSASYEARKFGVRSAMPTARALRLCPQAMVVPVPGKACRIKHRQIRAVLEKYSPIVSGASIDEWYCDLSGTERLYHDEPLEVTAHRIRDAVKAETGLSVSIGGGTNTLIAKLAVERAKPKPGTGATGVHIVAPGDEQSFMRSLNLADIPGVGPKSQKRLAQLGLVTVEDLLAQDISTLTRWVGQGEAEWLLKRAQGIGSESVDVRDVAKQVSREETFSRDITDDASLEHELLTLAARVGADLRSDGLAARTVRVKLRDADFTTRGASRTLREPIESDKAIADVAKMLLRRLRSQRRMPARLIGVAAAGLCDSSDRQLTLFDGGAESERDRAVSRVLDKVKSKFGESAVRRG